MSRLSGRPQGTIATRLITISVVVATLAVGDAAASNAGASLAPAAANPGALVANERAQVGDQASVPNGAHDLGPVPTSQSISAVVVLKPSEPNALARAAVEVSDPRSPRYHHFITPQEFARTYGPARGTVAEVEAVLRSEGLHVLGVSQNRLSIRVTGTASAVSSAFDVHMDAYQLPGGRRAFANASAPTLPSDVSSDVQAVIGLSTTQQLQPLGLEQAGAAALHPGIAAGTASNELQSNASGPQPCAAATSDGSSYGAYTENRLATAYGFNSLYSAGDLGAGVTVGLFELEPNLTSDVSAFESCFGTSTTVDYTEVDGGPGSSGAGSGEAALDIEDVLSLAPDVTVDVFQGPNGGTGPYDTYNAMIGSGGPKVISTSWGLCEPLTGPSTAESEETLFEEAATQGQTIVAAQGDAGSTDCYRNDASSALAVDDPGSDPYVTGVGGTTLAVNGSNQRSTETVWNESATKEGAGGGGISELWTMPTFQSGAPGALNVVNSNSSGTPCGAASGTYCRESPDVSADADPYTGYVIYYNGSWTAFGGTSAAAPLWGALTALADASAGCAPAGSLGLMNPDLYYLAGSSTANYSAAFYDVPSGSNNDYTPDKYAGGLYPTGTAYDMATGLGTPNAGGLVPLLCGPTVTRLVSSSGPAAGGGSVTITGTRFSTIPGDTTVKFGSSPAIGFTVVSTTQITATPPAGSGVVPVTVTVGGGTSPLSPADLYSYVPGVSGVSPNSGVDTGGTAVTIIGSGFTGATAVMFGATAAAAFTVVSATQVTATTPAEGAGTVNVMVTTPGGTSTASGADQFSFLAAPTVTGVTPRSGPTTGGTQVTITGTAFTAASAVDFGTGSPASFTVISATQITATAPAHAPATVDTTVTNPEATSVTSGADQYTYVTPPAVTAVNPDQGPTAGGTAVTITGTGFTGATVIGFGANPANSFTVVSATQILATTPSGSGTVDTTVTTADGTSATSSADQFTYSGPPTVSAISPSSGPLTGATQVTITGSGFTGVTAVTFGTATATSYTVSSSTQILATTPPGTGTVDTTVTAAGGTSTTSDADQFTYEAAPTVSAVSPASGPPSGGTQVTVTGTGFTGATAVRFGAAAATGFTVSSSTQILATTPPGTGTVDATVTGPGGTSATGAPDQFTYVAAPAVTAVSPAFGPISGGTQVTVTGTGFTGASAVRFGATAATGFTVSSSTQILATTPGGSGTVDATVTTPAGTSATGSADRFTYVGQPAVAGVSPSSGATAGGTAVTITGSNLSDATDVAFGGAPAAHFTVVSATSITATTGSASPGTVDVEVTGPGGTSPANPPNDQFTYVAAPTVTTVSPDSGGAAGGTQVTITGTGFTGATAVDFGANPATTYSVSSPTQILASTPAGTGTVDTTITAAGGTSSSSASDQFTYVEPPTVSGLSPASGPTAGGTQVTITGSGFTGATAVDFGTSPVTGFTVASSTQILASTPAGTGTVHTTVTVPVGGSSPPSAADQFTYAPVPTVTGISPTSGPSTGGTQVTITGTDLTGATGVAFGTTTAASFTVDSSTEVVATTPVGSDTVHTTVTTPGGTSETSSADQFTYVAAPTVSGLSPTSGPSAGGTQVTITGTGFTGATALEFGTTAAASYTVSSSTQIVATTPAGSGTVDTTVTSTGGMSLTSPADHFTYVGPPTVTSVDPGQGPTSGGTTVTITGTNLTGATAVEFGATPVGSFNVLGGDQIDVVSPPGTGTVDVRVTTPFGTNAAGQADTFAYVAQSPNPSPAPPSGAPQASGYDLVGLDGGVFVFGTPGQGFYGSLPGVGVHVKNIVGIVPTYDDKGYFLVGSDGGVFAFGDAPFESSLPASGVHVNDIVGIVPTADDKGYWVVGSNGAVYALGDAPFVGSAIGNTTAPIVGIAATHDSKGYWLVANDGGIFAFGDATVFGSLPGLGVKVSNVVAIVPTPDGQGYWLIGSDGGVFAFGDASEADGSLPGLGVHVNDVVGAVPTA